MEGLLALAKSWGVRGASRQPVFKSSCLTVSYTCLPCLPGGKTFLFWSYLFVFWRVVSQEKWESSQLGSWKRCMSVARWQGGKAGKIVRWQGEKAGKIVRWQGWRGGRVVRWQVGKGGRVVRWQEGNGGRIIRWQGGRFLVFFKSGVHGVSPRLHLFVFDVNQRNEVAGHVQDILL